MKKFIALVLTLALTLFTLGTLTSCGGAKFDESKNISVVTREDGSGTKSAFMEIIGLKGKSDVSGVIIGSSTAAVLNEVKSNPLAIGYDSLGYITEDVKMLKVDGVEATVENIKNGSYKISRPLNVVYQESKVASAVNTAFSTFSGTHHNIGRDLVFLIEHLPVYEKITEHLSEDYAFTCAYNEMMLSVVISKITDTTISDDISAILIVTDITKEKLIEKQKSDFFANASHELKTPITVMQGFAEVLLNKEGIDEGSKKQIARIYKESLRLGSLISDMLMLSKIESGDAPEKALTEVSLDIIASEIIGELSEEINKKNITAEIVGAVKITANQGMIYELIENLVSNAVKYNKDGGLVTVSLSETNAGAYLQVKDTGIGIEKEHLPRICERFYRVDKSHSKRIGGTGLGLAIVKHICAISGAELTIESEFGIGTTVTVVFDK